MTADIAFFCITLILAFLGWRSGALGQVLRVVAALVVIFATAPVSRVVREVAFGQTEPGSPVLEVGAMALAAVGLYIGVSLVGWIIIKGLHRASDVLSSSDHMGGLILGTVKAGLIVYVLASLLLMVFGALEASDNEDSLHLRDGHVTAFVSNHNLIAPWRYPEVGMLYAALRVAHHLGEHPDATISSTHKGAKTFLSKKSFMSLSKNADIVHMARRNQVAKGVFTPDVRAFLGDEELAGALKKIEWFTIETELGIEHLDVSSP